MGKWPDSDRINVNPPATYSWPRPGDFEIGSLKTRAAASALLNQINGGTLDRTKLTPFERAISEHEDPGVSAILVGLAKCAEVRARAFGLKLPTPERIRHQLRVAKLADKLCGGRFSEICNSDRNEEKRLRALAEDLIRDQSKGG